MTRAIHWFRNDLRLRDNTALADACRARELALVFVLDPRLLGDLRAPTPRVRFLFECLQRLSQDLPDQQRLILRRGKPEREIPKLLY